MRYIIYIRCMYIYIYIVYTRDIYDIYIIYTILTIYIYRTMYIYIVYKYILFTRYLRYIYIYTNIVCMYIYIRDIYIHIYIYISCIYNIHFDITMMIKYVRCLDDQDIHLIHFGFSDPHGDPLWDDNPHFFCL